MSCFFISFLSVRRERDIQRAANITLVNDLEIWKERARAASETLHHTREELSKERQISARRSSDVKMLLKQLEALQHRFNTLWSEMLGD